MEGTAQSVSPGASPPPTRRLRPRLGLLLAAVVCVLIGRGLGLFGTGSGAPATTTPDPERTSTAAAPPQAGTGAAPAGLATATAMREQAPQAAAEVLVAPVAAAPTMETAAQPPQQDEVSAPVPAAVPVAAAPAPSPPTPPRDQGIDDDRFAGILALVETRCAERQFGSALAALQHAARLPLDDGQRAAVDGANRTLRLAVTGAGRQVAALLGQGQVLAAREAVGELLAAEVELAQPALAEALGGAWTGESLARPVAAEDRPWPRPVPIARDRQVRARIGGGTESARVVDSRSDQVTVRVQRGSGVTFPTLAVVACEPVDATAAEAVEMGYAALHAGDPLLARLWLCCAERRGGRPRTPRADQLADVLR